MSSPEALNWLLDRGADITRSDETRRTARGRQRMMGGGKDYSLEVLNRAAGQGNVEMFEHLVQKLWRQRFRVEISRSSLLAVK